MSQQLPYETSDLSIKRVLVAGLVLTVATALSFVLMATAYRIFEARAAAADEAQMPATLVEVDGPQHPPEPILQGAPGSRFELRDPLPEMIEMLEVEDARLSGYGWTDRNADLVHIPIVEAKKKMLQRGFPTREAP